MNNSDVSKYYDQLSKSIKHPLETRNKALDFTLYDVDLVRRYAGMDLSLLDLGSGTGLLINPLSQSFKSIVAVEKYPEFSRFIDCHPNIEVINTDLLSFYSNKKFDVVTLFGVMNYFNRNEATKIYNMIRGLVHEHSVLIIKNQMGVHEDVVVEGWSEELQTNYFSQYRWLKSELSLLEGIGFDIDDVVDIYPEVFNRWSNTHFYAVICGLSGK